MHGFYLGVALTASLAAGCQKKAAQAAPAEPPPIQVSHPVERNITDYVDYTGRTDAADNVNVRARVTGYLINMPFEEGAEVAEGDLLFEIDPRPYKALVEQAESQKQLNVSQWELAKATYARDKAAGPDAVSQLQLDQELAAVDEAASRIKIAQASLDNSLLNLSFTKVLAPISGTISKFYYTRGNLVLQDSTLLTTIVAHQPMYVYFDVEEKTLDKLAKGTKSGKTFEPVPKPTLMAYEALAGGFAWEFGLSPLERSKLPVMMAIEGETDFKRNGYLNFINNAVNSATGTVAVRGDFPNKRTKTGLWELIPGKFVRVRLPIGDPFQATLVFDSAIGSDQGQKFVYVTDAENKVQYRRVITGSLQPDGLRVIEPYNAADQTGLQPTDWVVVGGLQQLRPRMEIQPQQVPMPILTGGGEQPSSRKKPQPPTPGEKKNSGEKKK